MQSSLYFFWAQLPPSQWARASSFLKFLDHTQRSTTVGRTPLDQWSARRRDLYLTTHNTHKKQTPMLPVEFEPTIPASDRPQTYALDRAATGTGLHYILKVKWSRYRRGVPQSVGRGIALLFHDRGTRRGWVVSSTPRPHLTPGKDPVPILREAGLVPELVWIPYRLDRSQSLYRLSYEAHSLYITTIKSRGWDVWNM